jgi:toxin secretion/phage lysis holin
MNIFSKIFDNWEIKAIISTLIVLFSPYQLSVTLLFIIIVIDTICGSFYAAKMGGFSSTGFKRVLGKIAAYAAAILVVRFAEAGIADIIETTAATHLIISFLIITEAISVLENLSLLGVPLPAGFVRIIEGNIKNNILKNLLSGGINKKEYESRIRDSVNFQIPGFKSKKFKKLIKLLPEEWIPAIRAIDMRLAGDTSGNADLIFFEVSGIVKITNSLITERWKASHVPAQCVELAAPFYISRMEKGMEPLEQLCKSQDTPDIKRKRIMECIIIALYKTVDELQKYEESLLKGKCDNPK